MKISVIIPVYNGEKWVAQCLENVLCQSYKNLEVIVVDDGSTDGTVEIVRSHYPGVTLLSQPNGGLSAARNAGIDIATGDYIHFMDVDDLINAGYYEQMAEAVLHTSADMAFGGVIHEATTRLSCSFSEGWLVTVTDDKFSLTDVGTNGCCWRYIIKKTLLDRSELRFEVGRSPMEDTLFSIQAVYMSHKVVTVPGATYFYKRRQGSIMRNKDPEAKRRRKENIASGNLAKQELIRQYGLNKKILGIHYVHKFQYKVFGIPVVEKKISNSRIEYWYLFGLRIAQVKQTS